MSLVSEKALATQVLVHQMKQSHAPHPEGTTEEMAVILGVSKQEVRRLKKAGELNARLQAVRPSQD